MRRALEALVVVAAGVAGVLMLAGAFWFIDNVLGYEPDTLIQSLLTLVGLVAGSSFGALYVKRSRANGEQKP
jgi:F0F1-type ATP synthase assembly protein I